MKLSSNELNRIKLYAANLAYLSGFLTNQEVIFYTTIAGSAFHSNKFNKRGLSLCQTHHFVEMGYAKKRVQTVLSRLTRLKIIKPHYFIREGNEMVAYHKISDFDGENGMGRKRIKYTKYEILLLPGESDLIKKAKKKKKSKKI